MSEPPDVSNYDASSAEKLLPLIYQQLRDLAAARLANEKPGVTIQATALVHEAYLRIAASDPQKWNSRGHFFAAAAEAMRRILVERARRKNSVKHGGEFGDRIGLTDLPAESASDPVDILAIDDALAKLEKLAPRQAEVVKLRYFAGLTVKETAEVLGVSTSTVDNLWAFAKTWLRRELLGRSGSEQPASDPLDSSENH